MSKPEKPTKAPPREHLNLTLAADVVAALRARSASTDVPLGRLVDAAVRAHLGLPDPRAAERGRA